MSFFSNFRNLKSVSNLKHASVFSFDSHNIVTTWILVVLDLFFFLPEFQNILQLQKFHVALEGPCSLLKDGIYVMVKIGIFDGYRFSRLHYDTSAAIVEFIIKCKEFSLKRERSVF